MWCSPLAKLTGSRSRPLAAKIYEAKVKLPLRAAWSCLLLHLGRLSRVPIKPGRAEVPHGRGATAGRRVRRALSPAVRGSPRRPAITGVIALKNLLQHLG
jgi:hypothetical protein